MHYFVVLGSAKLKDQEIKRKKRLIMMDFISLKNFDFFPWLKIPKGFFALNRMGWLAHPIHSASAAGKLLNYYHKFLRWLKLKAVQILAIFYRDDFSI
jgi:hypothetical protein